MPPNFGGGACRGWLRSAQSPMPEGCSWQDWLHSARHPCQSARGMFLQGLATQCPVTHARGMFLVGLATKCPPMPEGYYFSLVAPSFADSLSRDLRVRGKDGPECVSACVLISSVAGADGRSASIQPGVLPENIPSWWADVVAGRFLLVAVRCGWPTGSKCERYHKQNMMI